MIGVGSLTLSRYAVQFSPSTTSSPISVAPALISPSSAICLRCRLFKQLRLAGIWLICRKRLACGVECSKMMVVADINNSSLLQKLVDVRLKRSSECSGYVQALVLAGTYVLLQLSYILSRRKFLKELFERTNIWNPQPAYVYAGKVSLKFATMFIHVLNHICFGKDTSARISTSTNQFFGVLVFPNKLQHILNSGKANFVRVKAQTDAPDHLMDMTPTSEMEEGNSQIEKGQGDVSRHNSDKILGITESNLSPDTRDMSIYRQAIPSDSGQTDIQESEKEHITTKYFNQSQLYESQGDSERMEPASVGAANLEFQSKVGSSLKMVKPTIKREDLSFVEEETGLPMELVYSSKEKWRSKLEGQDISESSLTKQLSIIRQTIEAGSFHEARHLCQQSLERLPRNPQILVEYAHVERKMGNLAAARALFSDAVLGFKATGDLGEDYIHALQSWGSLEMKAKDLTKARFLFIEAFHGARKIELSTQNSDVNSVYGLHSWAMVEEKLGNWSKARELLERATSLQPGNAVVHMSRALLEARAHNYSTARNCFRLAVSSAPNDVKCWQAWALFEASQAKPRKMRQLFKQALTIDPKNLHSLQAWAHQESLIGTTESRARARDLYKKCTEIDPKNVFSWQAWAILERDSGNVHEARDLFEKALSIKPSDVPSLQAYANTERTSGNLEAACKLLRRALIIEPENAAALMEAALVEKSLGNEEAALEFFKMARRIDKQKSRIKREMFISRKTSPRSKVKRPLQSEKRITGEENDEQQ